MPRLLEEVRPARLDVEDQERLVAPRRPQVAADRRGVLADAPHPVRTGVARGDDRDELHRRQHLAPEAAVRGGAPEQPPGRRVGRADAQRAELVVLGCAVERDHAMVGQHAAPAARQLRRRGALAGARAARRRAVAVAAARPAEREHAGPRQRQADDAERSDPSPPVHGPHGRRPTR